jgi:mannitol/fructose-specific phosphotransferase system IIA component (Ntr-type)
MKVSEFFCFDSLVPVLNSNDRNGSIEELVGKLAEGGYLGKIAPEKITKAIIQREDDASTGIGKGVAVPHVKFPGIKKAIATVGNTDIGIDFSSLDKQPVYSVIVLISPEDNPDMHLQSMEQVFKLLQNDKCRKFLRQAKTSEQIKEVLIDFEEGSI